MDKTTVNDIEYRHYDHLYAVSIAGEVLSLRTMTITQSSIRNDGYYRVGRERLHHRMVATCWLLKPDEANHVHHKNHDKADNRAENLEWVTPKQHSAHHPRFGPIHTDESRDKLREYRTGTSQSKETKSKISSSLKQAYDDGAHVRQTWWVGRQHSEQTKQKMCQNHAKNTLCEVDGTVYPSFAAAGRARDERSMTLRKRCLSDNFPNYKLLNALD